MVFHNGQESRGAIIPEKGRDCVARLKETISEHCRPLARPLRKIMFFQWKFAALKDFDRQIGVAQI